MAREISITDNLSTIQITYVQDYPVPGASATDNMLKSQISNITMIDTDTVCIIFADQYRKPFIRLNWNEVVLPTPIVSGADLYAQLMAIWLNMPAVNIFTQTGLFTNLTLVDHIATWVLTITHPFATTNVFLVIQDNTGAIINTFPATVVDNATVTVDFGGAIVGNWNYTLIAIV